MASLVSDSLSAANEMGSAPSASTSSSSFPQVSWHLWPDPCTHRDFSSFLTAVYTLQIDDAHTHCTFCVSIYYGCMLVCLCLAVQYNPGVCVTQVLETLATVIERDIGAFMHDIDRVRVGLHIFDFLGNSVLAEVDTQLAKAVPGK